MNAAMTGRNRQLKNAEILIRRTALRLREMTHSSTVEDADLLRETLAQVDSLDESTMRQVFQK
jgi:hypothetical protein